MHPNDLLAALEWALRKAEAAHDDTQVRLMVIPALREMISEARKELNL